MNKTDNCHIAIQTDVLSLANGSQLVTATRGRGNAGNVVIQARDSAIFDGLNTTIFSNVAEDGIGKGGKITIQTSLLQLTNGAQFDVGTSGIGDAGTILVQADAVTMSGVSSNRQSSSMRSNVNIGAIGNSGEVNITTKILSITKGAGLTANTDGKGNAGTLRINASDIAIFDGSDLSGLNLSSATSQVLEGAEGNGGEIIISAGSLFANNGALLSATTFGRGNGGNVFIQVRNVASFDGTNAFGRSTAAGSQVGPDAIGKGGNFTIFAKSVLVTNGAQLSSGTFSEGDGGTITVIADSVELDGEGLNGSSSGIYSNVERGSFGQGGTLNIVTDALSITNGAGLFSNSFSVGRGGDINVKARSIKLANQGQISSSTTLSTAGNINLDVQDLILLRNNSSITTSANFSLRDLLFALLSFAVKSKPITIFAGDGGNIQINTTFLISAPLENSDISANAFRGRGGKVTIAAQGIYWFTPRSRADLARLLGTNDPAKLNPRLLPTNDITAISQGSPDLSGTVTLNTPDVDPSRGLAPLQIALVDPSQLIVQTCVPRGPQRASSFVTTGRGGLPASPLEPLQAESGLSEWVAVAPEPDGKAASQSSNSATAPDSAPIVEAQGWSRRGDGTIELVATVPVS